MSDRTACQAVIYDLSGASAEAVRDTLIGLGLGLDFGYGSGADDPLRLGEKYGDDEAQLDANTEVASALIESFPGITFEIWCDPKYEWDGAITMYAPDLGRFDGSCNADGESYLTTAQYRGLRANAGAEDVSFAIEQALGLPWHDRMTELREKLKVPVG